MFGELRHILSRFRINCFDINFILIFIGFSFFTSVSSLSSVLYRAAALGVAMICVIKRKKYFTIEKGNYYWFFIVLLFLFMASAVFGLYSGKYSGFYYNGGRNLALMFGFGIMLIPMLVAVKGFNELNQNTVLWVMLIILSVMLGSAITGSAIESNTGRYALNERQSTLAFGDNGSYLAILGSCLLAKLKNYQFHRSSTLLKAICIMAIIIGSLSALRSGSRGPVLGMLAGLLFIFSTIGLRKIILFLSLGIILVFALNIDTFIENFAAVFFDRMDATIEEGDMNGRDEIFALALQTIKDNPILGSSPIILGREAFVGYHNYYLTIGVGLGVIGLLCIITLVIMLLYKSYKKRHNIASPFNLFIISIFYVVAVRGITGINPFSDAIANTAIAYTAILMWKSNILINPNFHRKKKLKKIASI